MLANRSDIDLARQVTAPGATWLDHRLVERRADAAVDGRVRRRGPGSHDRPRRTPRRRGLRPPAGPAHRPCSAIFSTLCDGASWSAVGARLSAETGLPHLQAATGEQVAGTYRQSLTLTSGRFAMIDNGLGFQLVPWSPPLEKQLGRHVVGRGEGRRRDRMGVRAQARPWIIADARRPKGGRRSFAAGHIAADVTDHDGTQIASSGCRASPKARRSSGGRLATQAAIMRPADHAGCQAPLPSASLREPAVPIPYEPRPQRADLDIPVPLTCARTREAKRGQWRTDTPR